jgi:hypothetical protein
MWRVPEPSRGALTGHSHGGGGKPQPPRTLLQQALAAPLALLGGSNNAAGASPPPPAGALLSLGLYAAVAAGAWVLVRLQAQGGGVGLPWAPS